MNMPLKENEPVAFFELGNNREITITLGQSRPWKYIMLMPTDFRKKPIKSIKYSTPTIVRLTHLKLVTQNLQQKITLNTNLQQKYSLKLWKLKLKCSLSLEIIINGLCLKQLIK